ncbi:MAG TPA: hypothetical protein VMV48_14080 [Gallionellaceae bacterium]|nr:hypothetical protein [Gallionellaceae bacterium]
MNKIIKALLLAALMIFGLSTAMADDELLRPFVLASKGAGNISAKTEAAKAALTANGFTIVGTYSPYPAATILIVTNDELKKNAAESEFGGYGAAQRVAITKVKGEIQVSYTNPVYMANVYRMKGDLQNVAATLQKALGKVEEYGSKGITASKARKYHYMFGMEYFNEPSVLAEYSSYEEAIAAVEAGLAAKTEGVSKVYRIDIPGKKEAVFGVAMAGKPGTTKVTKEVAPGQDEQFGTLMTGAPEADQYIMSVVDFSDTKSTAYLPYEVLVSDKKVYALYARFRIALSFPNLKMMGSNSFMNIMESPEAIRNALQKTVTVIK